MIQLIVDDGVRDRGHRKNIFIPEYRLMGCFSGYHKQFKTMTAINYAGDFKTYGEDIDEDEDKETTVQ